MTADLARLGSLSRRALKSFSADTADFDGEARSSHERVLRRDGELIIAAGSDVDVFVCSSASGRSHDMEDDVISDK